MIWVNFVLKVKTVLKVKAKITPMVNIEHWILLILTTRMISQIKDKVTAFPWSMYP